MGLIFRSSMRGFTFIEMIMSVVLLSMISVLVIPIIGKPFSVYQLSQDIGKANEQAILAMHFIEQDLQTPMQLIEVRKDGTTLILENRNKKILYQADVGNAINQESLLYREVVSLDRVSQLKKSPVIEDVQSLVFKLEESFLSINLDIKNISGDVFRYWKKIPVHISSDFN